MTLIFHICCAFASLIILACIKYIWSMRKIYILSWKLPGPITLPILGNALTFLCKEEDIFDIAIEMTKKYPSPMRFWFGPKFTVIFTNVEHAEKILTSMKLISKDPIYKFMKEFNGEGLITGSGAKWKKDRKLMSPLFKSENIVCYFPFILNHSKCLAEHLKEKINGPTFNVKLILQRCVTDYVSESIIGLKGEAQNGNMDKFLKVISRMYVILHARIIKVWLQLEWFFKYTSLYKEQEDAKVTVFNLMRKAIVEADHRRHLNELKLYPRSFVDKMLDIKYLVNDFANEQELIHHLCTLYSASEDTITIICSFALVLLGMYPYIQDKVMEEIHSVVGFKKNDLTLEDIYKLQYLEMCIKDILRLFPIAPFIMRMSSTDIKIDNLDIPKGCSIILFIHRIHRDPNLWKHPDEFYPEHFLPEEVAVRHQYAFLPFSAGPRSCLGKQYAYLSMKTTLATILQNYVIEADGKLADKKLKTDISVRFRDDQYLIRIKPRYSMP